MTEYFRFLYDVVAETTRSVGDTLYWWVFFNPVLTFVGFWALLFAVWILGARHFKKNKRGTDFKMAQRKAYLDRVFADMIGDGLSELYLSGKINSQEYRRCFKMFGVKYGLTDLLPRKLHPSAIKSRVIKNTSSVKLLDEHGNPIQPSIPGPKPGEVCLPPTKEPKRWVVIRKKLSHKAA